MLLNSFYTAAYILDKDVNKFSPFNKQRAYWISQVTGWSLFAVINLLIIYIFDQLSFQRIIIFIFFCISGLILTHIYRGIIARSDWLILPLKKIIPRIVAASFIIGTILYLILYSLSYFSGTPIIAGFKTAGHFVGAFNLSTIIFIWSLIYFAFHYFENYKNAEIESYIWEAAVKDFELKTLKSQLNPHFMFNALNSIRALIEEEPAAAQNAVTKLSNILRYSLRMERTETVPLWDEIETVKDYLALEKTRFEERLRYNFKIEPEVNKIEIPPMMIQTLVENGIKHGISKKTEGGEIFVSASLENSFLKIVIENSGRIEQDSLHTSKGFGINNTKHRLNLLYGENASFNIFNSSNEKVIAEVKIPSGGLTK
jgi:two-component system, LytTR family, sensor kinase